MPRDQNLSYYPGISAGLLGTGGYEPLCPMLYRALQERLGAVKLASPGESFQAAWVPNPALGRMVLSIASPGEYYRVSCPYCNDSRQRLWVNHMFAQTDSNNRRMSYLAHCYNEDCLSRPGMRAQFEDLILGMRNVRERRMMVVREGRNDPVGLFDAEPPGTCLSLTQLYDRNPNHKAVQYMLGERRYTFDMLQKYQVEYCLEAKPQYQTAQDRIIFPIHFDGRCVGWQARFIGEINWSLYNTPKYYTLPGFHKRLCLYNYDVAKHKDFVVVVEGVTDVHTGGDHFVALLGKSLSQHQRMLLLNIGERKPIIFLLDPGTREEVEGMIASITNAPGFHPVISIDLPGDLDPGQYARSALWNVVTAEANRRGLDIRFAA